MVRFYVVDAGVLFSTWPLDQRNARFVTTSDVLNEVVNRPSRQRAETLAALGRLTTDEPETLSLRTVRDAAMKTGDATVLSQQDIGLVALALTLKQRGEDVRLVSTDLAVLNTAEALGIPVEDPSGRYRGKVVWTYVCPECGHRMTPGEMVSDDICPVCGSRMRRRRRR